MSSSSGRCQPSLHNHGGVECGQIRSKIVYLPSVSVMHMFNILRHCAMKKNPVEVFEELVLEPQLSDGEGSEWIAICPNGYDHKLEIDLRKGLWICEKCCDKGDEADIRILDWKANQRAMVQDQKPELFFKGHRWQGTHNQRNLGLVDE